MSFDPLLVFIGSVTADKSGWYTCAAGNSEGRSEISTYLDIRAGKTQVKPWGYFLLKNTKIG